MKSTEDTDGINISTDYWTVEETGVINLAGGFQRNCWSWCTQKELIGMPHARNNFMEQQAERKENRGGWVFFSGWR